MRNVNKMHCKLQILAISTVSIFLSVALTADAEEAPSEVEEPSAADPAENSGVSGEGGGESETPEAFAEERGISSPFEEEVGGAVELPEGGERPTVEGQEIEDVNHQSPADHAEEASFEAAPVPAPAPAPSLNRSSGPQATVEVRAEPGEIRAPRVWHIRVTGGATQMIVRSESFDAVNSDDRLDLSSVDLGFEWGLLGGTLPLAVHIGYAMATVDEQIFHSMDTSMRVDALQIGVTAGYRLWDVLMPYVRGGVSLTWTDLRIYGQGAELGGDRFAVGGFGMAGFEVQLPRRWLARLFRRGIFTFGFRAEAGYVHLGTMEYEESTDSGGLIEERQVALGALSLGGAAVHFGAFLSF